MHAIRDDATSTIAPATTLTQTATEFLSSIQDPRAAETSNKLLHALVSQILTEEKDL